MEVVAECDEAQAGAMNAGRGLRGAVKELRIDLNTQARVTGRARVRNGRVVPTVMSRIVSGTVNCCKEVLTHDLKLTGILRAMWEGHLTRATALTQQRDMDAPCQATSLRPPPLKSATTVPENFRGVH